MKRKVFYRWGIVLLVLIVGYSLCGCRSPRDERDRLRRAEMLMDSLPAVSLSLLDSVSSDRLRGNDVPLYALLKSQADYRNEIPFTTDSLILLAAQHYGTHRKSTRAALSQYYLGCAYKNLGRDTDAIDALLRATYLFPDTTSRYYALSYFELGRLYIYHNINDKSVEALQKYKESPDCVLYPVFDAITDYFIALAYLYKEEYQKSDSLFRDVINNPYLTEDYRIDSYFQLAKINYYDYHNIDKAAEYLYYEMNLFPEKDRNKIGGSYAILGDIWKERQNVDSSYYYFKKSIQCINSPYVHSHSYWELAKLSVQKNQIDSIFPFINLYETANDSIEQYENKVKIFEIENRHHQEIENRETELENLRTKVLYGSMSVFAFVLCAFALILADRKRKVEIIQFQKQLNDIKQQQIELALPDELPEDEDNDEKDVRSSVYDSDVSTMAVASLPELAFHQQRIQLCRQQFDLSDWKRHIYSHPSDVAEGRKMSQERREKLTHYIDDLFVDVFFYLAQENPKLTKIDLHYCAMAILGLDFAQMAYCTSASAHAYHCRQGRMKDKLSDEWYKLIYGKEK